MPGKTPTAAVPIEFHPIAAMFPLLEGEELEALAEDIRQHGLRESATMFEGKILDGRNRAAACLMAGVPLLTRNFEGTEEDAIDFVWSENRPRRHLNPGQIAIATVKRDKLREGARAKVEKLKADAKGRQRADGRSGASPEKRLEPRAPQAGVGRNIKAGLVVQGFSQLRGPIPAAVTTTTRRRYPRGETQEGRSWLRIKPNDRRDDSTAGLVCTIRPVVWSFLRSVRRRGTRDGSVHPELPPSTCLPWLKGRLAAAHSFSEYSNSMKGGDVYARPTKPQCKELFQLIRAGIVP